MNEMNVEVITACIDLIGFLFKEDSEGFELDIKTPKGNVHCKFEYTIELKNQEKND